MPVVQPPVPVDVVGSQSVMEGLQSIGRSVQSAIPGVHVGHVTRGAKPPIILVDALSESCAH